MAQLYQLVTAVAAGTTVDLRTVSLDATNANQNARIIDFDLTAGNATVSLPSLTSMFFGTNSSGGGMGAGSTTFYLNGTITAGAFPRTLTLSAYTTEGDTDTICGDATVTLNGVSTGFHLYIAGRHMWGLHVCTPNTQS